MATVGSRFAITRSTTDELGLIGADDADVSMKRSTTDDSVAGTAGAAGTAMKGHNRETEELIGANGGGRSRDVERNLALYEDDVAEQPLVSRIISQLANYEGGIIPMVEQHPGPGQDGQSAAVAAEKAAKKPKKLGTVLGVFFPCVQNIFGIILFIRMVWLVGTAGLLEGFAVVFFCCMSTFVTSISLSAVATNGVMKKGGSYFMISRTLGPEFGGAVGVLFYLGNSFAAAMYIVGAVEIFLNYILPDAAIFKPMTDLQNAYNNFRVYGTCILIALFLCVFIGVRFVSKFAPVALFAVLFSILCVYIGVFLAGSEHSPGPKICLLGERLLTQKSVTDDLGVIQCNKNVTGPIFYNYCGNTTLEQATNSDDPYCMYFMNNSVRYIPGIPGLTSGVFKENLWPKYNQEGDLIGGSLPGDKKRGEIVSDMATSVIILIGIFFPSVTGIMAGSNRSADLADAQKSIPTGTILATSLTSLVYISCFILFGCIAEGQLLRDKFGDSIGTGLIVAQFAWPTQWVILIGSFLATVGAGLQSLTSAPRLLHAVASDEIIPFLRFFSVASANGEPRRALILTLCISECGILLGNLDLIAPIITMFLLMCYTFVNVATLLQTLMKAPSWRPRFRFYHWSISLFGVILCLSIMFISGWYYALVALVLALGIYKYIEFEGAKKEWGDGMRGLAMSAARYSLLRLQEGQPHVKNWRPQVLILLKTNDTLQPEHPKMLSLARQLKTGKGLTLVTSVLQGTYAERVSDMKTTRELLNNAMKVERVKGFADIVIAKNVTEGLVHAIQTAGVGGLRHNTVMVCWPSKRHLHDAQQHKAFGELLQTITMAQHALLMVKNIDSFPEDNGRMTGVIDIWWIINDGGILIMLAFLLTHHKVWRGCSIRLFSVAQSGDNNSQIEKDLKKFMYQLRIVAEVIVVELPDKDISAYTYEKTLMLEQRNAMLKNIKRRDSKAAPDEIMDQARRSSIDGKKGQGNKLDKVKEQEDVPPPYPADEGTSDAVADSTDAEVATTTEEAGSESKRNSTVINDKAPSAPPHPASSSSSVANANASPTPDGKNIARMETAIRLNQIIVEQSASAQLVIINLPCPPKHIANNDNYMDFLEVLTEGLNRVLMVRGSGREYVTIYS